MLYYTPLRYPGGKARLYNFVEKMIESNFEATPIYCEPYAGGFGLGMKLLLKEKVSKVYINDYDNAIYSFWKAILEYTDDFIYLIKNANLSIDEWKKQKSIYLSDNSSILEKGFATFYLNRTNRSGIILAGPIGGFKQEGNYKINCRFNKNNLIDIIKAIASKKDCIVVSCLDGKEFLTKIDKEITNALIYLDPPYVEKGSELYKNSFSDNDHTELCNTVKNIKNRWFVTYDDNNLVEKLYEDMGITKYEISYSVQTKRLAKEIAVFSSNLVNINIISI